MNLRRILLLLPLLFSQSYLLHLHLGSLAFNGLDVLFVVAILSSLPELISFLKKPSLYMWLGVAFILIGVLATYAAPDKSVALGALKSFVFLPILYCWTLAGTAVTIKEIVLSLFFSLCLDSAAGFLLLAHSTDHRLQAWYESANYFSLAAVPILILSFEYLYKKYWQLALWIVALVASLLTLSLGGYLGLAAGGVVLWLLYRHHFFWVRLIATALFAIVIILPFAIPLHAYSSFSSRSESLTARVEIWHTATLLIKEHPILGGGLRQFGTFYTKNVTRISAAPIQYSITEPHNLFLGWWVNFGLPGAILLLIIWSSLFVFRFSPQPYQFAALAAFVSLLAHGIDDTPYFPNNVMLIFWIILLLALYNVHTQKPKKVPTLS